VTPPRGLFDARWVHVFEEDGPEGQVYRPETGKVPPSRRPRRRVSFSPDGSACVTVSGPDDRLHDVEARWNEKDGEVTVTPSEAARRGSSSVKVAPMRFRLEDEDRLVLRP
jgi:hypothetical protein